MCWTGQNGASPSATVYVRQASRQNRRSSSCVAIDVRPHAKDLVCRKAIPICNYLRCTNLQICHDGMNGHPGSQDHGLPELDPRIDFYPISRTPTRNVSIIKLDPSRKRLDRFHPGELIDLAEDFE